MLVLFKALESVMETGRSARIIWKYDEDDDLMEIKGKEFKRMLKVPLELSANS